MDDLVYAEGQDSVPPTNPDPKPGERKPDRQERDVVAELTDRIKADYAHHKPAFEKMREDMAYARTGAGKKYSDKKYVANITGRHVNQKVAALYAKNPKATAERRPRLDFVLWDENEDTLLQALLLVQQGMGGGVDPATQMPVAAMDPMFSQAFALVQDYQRGMQFRQQVERFGTTLELLFAYFTDEQSPVDFKTSMKQLVRRSLTTGVGYCVLGFQREFREDAHIADRIADFRSQIEHLRVMVEESQDAEDPEAETKQRKAELQMKALQEQKYVLSREGLVFEFPSATRVIPDKKTRNLVGFVGARWLTIEYLYTPHEVKKFFRVDLDRDQYKPRREDGTSEDPHQLAFSFDGKPEAEDLVCVWQHFDREAGVVYYLADGYGAFLREPAAPDIYVEDFWPVFALTFNEVEDEENLYPPSDVRLMRSMQDDYNDARQGRREHRKAARPRFWSRSGALDDESKQRVQQSQPFDVSEIAMAEGKFEDNFGTLPVPGVDPNLYETDTLFTDVQISVGAQEAQFGAVAKATATESSIAEGSRIASVDSNVEDLDAFLTRIARASGQILANEMSQESVVEIVGPGAEWPELTLDQIAREVSLKIEAGSSGKPNQAQEIRNWKEMLPFLIQMPNIAPTWLAKESLRRLDDRMDLTEALTENMPAIVAQNRMAQPAIGDPMSDPAQQGDAGADNGPQAPGGPTGSDAPMGNNQQPV